MASDKKEKKLEILLSGLTNGKLSLVQIGELLKTNRSNSYNLLNELKDRGYEIRKEVDGKKVSYYITEEITAFTHISKNTLNKYMILNVLGRQENFTRPKLVKYFEESNEENPSVIIRKSRLYELIHELLREKAIYMDGDVLRISHTQKSEILSFDSIEDLYTLYYRINSLEEGCEEAAVLKSLNDKLSMLTGNIDQTTLPNSRYMVDSKASSDIRKIVNSMQHIEKSDYRENVVKLSYQTKNKGMREVYVGIGMNVFCAAKGKAFVMGWGFNPDTESFPKNHLEIIPADSISSVESTDFDNPFYMDEFFKEQFEAMLLVSSEGARPVEIEFDNEEDVLKRALTLSKHRPLSKLKTIGNKLVYEDSISGLNDVIAYVNTFTDKANIVKPKKTKEDQKVSVMKALKRYGEV